MAAKCCVRTPSSSACCLPPGSVTTNNRGTGAAAFEREWQEGRPWIHQVSGSNPFKAIYLLQNNRTGEDTPLHAHAKRGESISISVQSELIKAHLDFPGREKCNQGCVSLFREVLNGTDTPIVGV